MKIPKKKAEKRVFEFGYKLATSVLPAFIMIEATAIVLLIFLFHRTTVQRAIVHLGFFPVALFGYPLFQSQPITSIGEGLFMVIVGQCAYLYFAGKFISLIVHGWNDNIQKEAPTQTPTRPVISGAMLYGIPASFHEAIFDALWSRPGITKDEVETLTIYVSIFYKRAFPAGIEYDPNGQSLWSYVQNFVNFDVDIEKQTKIGQELNDFAIKLEDLARKVLLIGYRVTIPEKLRAQHHHIIAPPGSGKSTLLRDMIMADVEAGNSVVLIDSQTDLIEQLREVLPLDKLVVIDPTDVEFPLALNFMDIGQNRPATSQLEREQAQNSAVSLFTYIFAALLESPMTSKQQTLFEFSTRLLMTVPGATLSSLRKLFEEGGLEQYRPYIEKLSQTQQDFFKKRFNDSGYRETKEQILRRIYGMSAVPTLDRMFSQPVSKFDMFAALEEGKVVLVNTAKSLLQDEGAALFGRLFISMVRQACFNRANQKNRKRTYLYLDEAHEYLDENTTTLLEQARKFEIGLIISHQNFNQLTSTLAKALTTGTAIKFAGKALDMNEAKAISATMRTTVDRMEALPPYYFLAYLANIGTFDYRVSEDRYRQAPRHSWQELQAHKEHMRELYSQATNQPEKPDSSDDDDGEEQEAGAWT